MLHFHELFEYQQKMATFFPLDIVAVGPLKGGGEPFIAKIDVFRENF
jgi:hypothetical protein